MATLTHGERRNIPDRRTGGTRVHGARRMKALEWIPMLLLIVGGINWGLVGLFDVNLVAMIFGEGTGISRVVYALVGLSALYSLYLGTRMSSSHG